MINDRADVIVVGVGAVGSAALLALARQGISALGIDRFAPPHDRGSSHGETRVIRHATGEGAEFVPLVQRSHALWSELAIERGVELFRRCGFLAVDASGGTAGRHGRAGFFETTVAIAERFGIAYTLPDTEEARRRFPAFLLQGDERLFFEPGAGLMFPERVIETQIDAAVSFGARMRRDERVIAISSSSSGTLVETNLGRYAADRVIVTAGAGIGDLLPPLRQRVRLLRQTLHWFPPVNNLFGPDRFPTFLWLYGPSPEESFYGFPALCERAPAVKLSQEQFGRESECWDMLDRRVDPCESSDLYRHVGNRLDWLSPVPNRTAACVYSHTLDGRFIIEPVDDPGRILAVSACSGHGFKHSAAVGEQAANWSVATDPPVPATICASVAPQVRARRRFFT